MSAGIKLSAAAIIADFCGPLASDKENEPDLIAISREFIMAREVITALAISNICAIKPVESVMRPTPFVNEFVSLNRDTDAWTDSTKLELAGIWCGVKINL